LNPETLWVLDMAWRARFCIINARVEVTYNKSGYSLASRDPEGLL